MDRVYSVYLSNETSATGEPTWSGVYDKPDFFRPGWEGERARLRTGPEAAEKTGIIENKTNF